MLNFHVSPVRCWLDDGCRLLCPGLEHTGPALTVSFLIAGVAAALSALSALMPLPFSREFRRDDLVLDGRSCSGGSRDSSALRGAWRCAETRWSPAGRGAAPGGIKKWYFFYSLFIGIIDFLFIFNHSFYLKYLFKYVIL
jgi:hypothetical protein